MKSETEESLLGAASEISSKRSVRVNCQISNESTSALDWITSEYNITQKEVFEIISKDKNILKRAEQESIDMDDAKVGYSTKVISKGALTLLENYANSTTVKRDKLLSNAIIILKDSLENSQHLNHSDALQMIGEFWSYCEKVEKDLELTLTSNDPILSRFGIIVVITANLYSTIQAKLKHGIEIDPDDFSQTGVETKSNTESIVFEKTITKTEYKSKYLNLKDDSNKSYGKYFPKHKTPLLIISNNKEYRASKKDRTQIWGGLQKWYKDENIKVGDIIRITYNIEEEPIGSRVPVYIDVIKKG